MYAKMLTFSQGNFTLLRLLVGSSYSHVRLSSFLFVRGDRFFFQRAGGCKEIGKPFLSLHFCVLFRRARKSSHESGLFVRARKSASNFVQDGQPLLRIEEWAGPRRRELDRHSDVSTEAACQGRPRPS